MQLSHIITSSAYLAKVRVFKQEVGLREVYKAVGILGGECVYDFSYPHPRIKKPLESGLCGPEDPAFSRFLSAFPGGANGSDSR
jgi:hypothetical protein